MCGSGSSGCSEQNFHKMVWKAACAMYKVGLLNPYSPSSPHVVQESQKLQRLCLVKYCRYGHQSNRMSCPAHII